MLEYNNNSEVVLNIISGANEMGILLLFLLTFQLVYLTTSFKTIDTGECTIFFYCAIYVLHQNTNLTFYQHINKIFIF